MARLRSHHRALCHLLRHSQRAATESLTSAWPRPVSCATSLRQACFLNRENSFSKRKKPTFRQKRRQFFEKQALFFKKRSHVFKKRSHVFKRLRHFFKKRSHVFKKLRHVFKKRSHVFKKRNPLFHPSTQPCGASIALHFQGETPFFILTKGRKRLMACHLPTSCVTTHADALAIKPCGRIFFTPRTPYYICHPFSVAFSC